MNSMASPGPQGSGSGGKAKRAQNIIPLLIQEVLNAPEEGFSIEGTEVGMVTVVGKVLSVDKAATKTTYQIEDSTGEVEGVQWVQDGSTEKEHYEGTFVRMVGSIRTQGEKRHLVLYSILEVPTTEERDFHALQVAYSHLKLKQLNAKMNGEMDHSGLSNSMMGGGLGGTNFGGAAMSSSASFGNKNYDTVYNLIRQNTDDQGINITALLNEVKGKMSKQEMDGAIDFLSSEGHIYSTIDDEHFKTTDAD